MRLFNSIFFFSLCLKQVAMKDSKAGRRKKSPKKSRKYEQQLSARYGFSYVLSFYTSSLFLRAGKVKFYLEIHNKTFQHIEIGSTIYFNAQSFQSWVRRKNGLNIGWNENSLWEWKDNHKLECKQIYEIKKFEIEEIFSAFLLLREFSSRKCRLVKARIHQKFLFPRIQFYKVVPI